MYGLDSVIQEAATEEEEPNTTTEHQNGEYPDSSYSNYNSRPSSQVPSVKVIFSR